MEYISPKQIQIKFQKSIIKGLMRNGTLLNRKSRDSNLAQESFRCYARNTDIFCGGSVYKYSYFLWGSVYGIRSTKSSVTGKE